MTNSKLTIKQIKAIAFIQNYLNDRAWVDNEGFVHFRQDDNYIIKIPDYWDLIKIPDWIWEV